MYRPSEGGREELAGIPAYTGTGRRVGHSTGAWIGWRRARNKGMQGFGAYKGIGRKYKRFKGMRLCHVAKALEGGRSVIRYIEAY